MIATAKSKVAQTHMTIVSSRNSTMPLSMPAAPVIASDTPLRLSSEAANFPPGTLGGFVQYGRSKLYLEYALRRLVKIPALYENEDKPLVIVNSVCPGMTVSDLGRSYESWVLKLVQKLLFTLFAKSTADGANSSLTALSQGEESMGQMWANDQISPEWTNLTSTDGQKLGDNVWKELQVYINSTKSGSAGHDER